MKDWRVDTLYGLSPARAQALERAATVEVACEFCGQPAGLWCRLSQTKFEYIPSPHMARKFSWLELAGTVDAALLLLDTLWTSL